MDNPNIKTMKTSYFLQEPTAQKEKGQLKDKSMTKKGDKYSRNYTSDTASFKKNVANMRYTLYRHHCSVIHTSVKCNILNIKASMMLDSNCSTAVCYAQIDTIKLDLVKFLVLHQEYK
jgi:hypothetical protein